MQSLQSQQAALSQTERISQIKSTVEEAFSDSKEEKENRATKDSGEKMHEEAREKALAALPRGFSRQLFYPTYPPSLR